MNTAKVIGITGGIGVGKTTICKVFKSLGVPIYSSDERAKFILNSDDDIKHQIITLFGSDAYSPHYDARFVSKCIVDNPALLPLLNAIIHPAVKNDFKIWVNEHQEYPYLLNEAALLFETKTYLTLFKTILVISPLALRIERIKKRDPQRSEDEIVKIINAQMSDDEKINLTDFIIYNNKNDSILEQIWKIHTFFSKLN